MSAPPLFPFAPKEYSADQINQFARVLTQYLNQAAADVNASLTSSAMSSNVIASTTLVAAGTSYMVVSYLTVSSDLTINGNLMVDG
jgi:1-aminocyclopropane-1-carboxylate deaminase/D-cysteine desulfhydrase-like pyridoxal-dependent ACC family enzyme